MSRKQHFVSGWNYPISPKTVVERTLQGGYTVSPSTGQEPTTGTMVSIPGHEVVVPAEKLSTEDVAGFVTPERQKLFTDKEMHLGTWRSSDDPEAGDAAFLDISKRYPDTGEGAVAARKAAMEGSQWALFNIDRKRFEKNITKPEVVANIKQEQKVEIPEEEIKRYAESTDPVGEHLALGWRTEPDVIRLPSGRKKTVAGTGQGTFVELGSKAD